MSYDNVPKIIEPIVKKHQSPPCGCYCTAKLNNTKDIPIVTMNRHSFDSMMFAICSRPVERGGLLLGKAESNDVTDFFFDAGADTTSASYSPDYKTISKKLKEEWIPNGIDYKGIAHSHPGKLDGLTPQDLAYIKRLLVINPQMDMFIAPIIIPHQFRMRMMVVFRDNPDIAVEARTNFF